MLPRRHGLLLSLAAAVAVAGCAAPDYTYVSSDEQDVVIRVPQSWERLDPNKVTPPEQGQAQPQGWVAYYDAARRPDPAHARSDTVQDPVMTVRSISLSKDQAAQLTPEQLRDLLTPVTDSAQMAFVISQTNAGQPVPKFHLISDHQISTRAARGVHVVIGYDLGAGEEVYDKVVVTNPDKTRLHLLVVHCAVACYTRRSAEISSVTDSFTVKAR